MVSPMKISGKPAMSTMSPAVAESRFHLLKAVEGEHFGDLARADFTVGFFHETRSDLAVTVPFVHAADRKAAEEVVVAEVERLEHERARLRATSGFAAGTCSRMVSRSGVRSFDSSSIFASRLPSRPIAYTTGKFRLLVSCAEFEEEFEHLIFACVRRRPQACRSC